MRQDEPGGNAPLVWLHVGDLHVTEPELDNHRALQRIVADIDDRLADQVDFVFLPGDNADQGTPAQYRLVREAIDRLRVPVRIIPGDHDFEPGALDAYHAVLGAEPLPAAHVVAGTLCLFLDIVSAGGGGPDFRVGDTQFAWLERQLRAADRAARPVALFMHSYPADLGPDADRMMALLADSQVRVIDMGHTHYNELANDGRVIYAATRSTGQIEEGAAGYALMALDGDAVSWRFKPLESAWPLVMITAPADRRLATARSAVAPGPATIRARVLGAPAIAGVTCRIDDAPAVPMRDQAGLWSLDWTAAAGAHRIVVRAITHSGDSDSDAIDIVVGAAASPAMPSLGSDAHSIGAWPERHVLGTQLGPNRNGRKW